MSNYANDPTNEENGQDPMNQQTNQQSTMGQTPAPQPQQTPPPTSGGTQSSTIQGGPTQANTAPTSTTPNNKPKKGVGSGMHSNLNKYKQANAPQVRKMSQKMTQNVQQRAGDVQASTQAKQNQFQQATASEKARIGGGLDFAKGLINKATNVNDISVIQQQQADVKSQLDALSGVAYGSDDWNKAAELQKQYQDYETQLKADPRYNQEFDQLKVDERQMGIDLNELQTQSDNFDRYYQDKFISDQYGGSNPFTSYNMYRDKLASGGTLSDRERQIYDYQKSQRDAVLAGINAEEMEAAKGDLSRDLSTKQAEYDALNEKLGGMKRFNDIVTDEDLKRFQALQSGQGKFKSIQNINLTEEARKGKALQDLASRIPTEKGQEQLLRSMIGRSDYSRGQSALDSFLIGSDKQAREDLIRGTRDATKGLTRQVEDARQESTNTISQLADQAREIQKTVTTGVSDAQKAIDDEIIRKHELGEGALLTDIQKRLGEEGVGLTEEQVKMLGFDKDAQMYGFDPSQFKYNKEDYSRADFTTASDVARAEALAKLAGRGPQSQIAEADLIRQRAVSGEYGQADQANLAKLNEYLQGKRDEFARVRTGGGASQIAAWDAERRGINNWDGLSDRGKAGKMWDLYKRMKAAGGRGFSQDQASIDAYNKFKSDYFTGNVRQDMGDGRSLTLDDDVRRTMDVNSARGVYNDVYRDWGYWD